MLREPAVAGAFYPADKLRLRSMLEGFLADGEPLDGAVAGVAPHAGYVYSGPAAGALLGAVDIPETVVILGPNHRALGKPYGLYDRGAWRTPLGDVAIDEAFAAELLAKADFLASDTASHVYEHSIEVQVPFLQFRRPDVKIVPVSIGGHDLRLLEALGAAIAAAAADLGVRPFVLASSDMTHYESAEEASRKDRMAIERMLALDEEGLWEVVRRHGISMCGVAPAVAVMRAAREMGAGEGRLMKYTNSGEAAGDYAEVVGYASVAFTRGQE